MVVHLDTLNRRSIQVGSCCRLCRHEDIRDATDGHDAEHVTHDVARGVANTLNLDIVFSQVLPADKDAYVSRLQEEGDRVGMVGDGVNDAPALVRSDIGIAIGSGTDVAVQSADLVLVKSDPRDVVKILRLSSASYRKQLQNIWWGAGYNIVMVPLAAGVLVPWGDDMPPAVGAALMSLSTIIVAVNAQLLRRLDLEIDAE